MQKKHRGGRTALCVLLVLLIAAGIACYLLRDTLSLAYYAFTTPKEAVQSQKAENDKKTNELLNELIPEVTMRDLTEEERALLASGALSYEDALALIRGETVVPVTTAVPVETAVAEPVATTVPDEPAVTVGATTVVSEPKVSTTEPTVTTVTTTTVTTTTVTAAATEKIDLAALQRRQEDIIAEIYLLRATYLNEIDQLIKDTKQAYINLPKEQHNLQGKMKVVDEMLPVGTALEEECDAKMEALLTELTEILGKLGTSTEIVDEIRKTYSEQKYLKKTELLNEYLPKMD